jgi:ArsR family metal-binding transcriptional regulator
MLIESYELDVETSDHSTEEFEYEAIARLSVDISEALPYLNATLGRGIYLPDGPVLSWRHEGHNIGFWPDRIAVDHVDSREQVKEVVDHLVKLVNDVWEKRDQIEPDTTTHERLQPLEILKLLPKTNCKICGESTCFNFAIKLAAAETQLEKCTPLYDEEAYEEQRGQLGNLLATKWPTL